MTFHYRIEYGLGTRGRVCRTYSGIQALIAIAFDLTLGLIFGVFGLACRLVRCLVVTAWRVAVALVSLPLKVARAISYPHSNRQVVKPAWASIDEL